MNKPWPYIIDSVLTPCLGKFIFATTKEKAIKRARRRQMITSYLLSLEKSYGIYKLGDITKPNSNVGIGHDGQFYDLIGIVLAGRYFELSENG